MKINLIMRSMCRFHTCLVDLHGFPNGFKCFSSGLSGFLKKDDSKHFYSIIFCL